ncbi:Ribokinase-like protein [Obelidium mucronatum]|nr:Ribokinase-like protein [Obelidium mucronatum]
MHKQRIVCFGSLNIDKVFAVPSIVKKGETIASLSYAEYPGGKGANQSVALARAATANIAIHHVGQVGKDGTWLVDLLNENNIDTSSILISSSHNSGCAIIQKDNQGDNAIVLVPGANTAIPPEHITKSLATFGKDDYLLIQNEINNVSEIIKAAKDREMKVVFNPAPCPPNIAEYPLDNVDVLILNEGEARALIFALSGRACDGDDLATPVMNLVPSLDAVIVTRGEIGASAAHRKIITSNRTEVAYIQVPALHSCLVKDTTGAGDTFVGFFLATYASATKDNLPNAFEYAMKIATAASGIACETDGAIPSIPHLETVLKRSF